MARMRPDLRDRSNPCESFAHDRGDFTFGGHRLSSLYRAFTLAFSDLTKRYFAISSLQKYSNSTDQGALVPESMT